MNVLVTVFKETILAECAGMIKSNETESKLHRICFSIFFFFFEGEGVLNYFIWIMVKYDFFLKND